MTTPLFSPADAAALVRVPREHDDKYARGVLGVVTGSAQYPGAAVLSVEAALRTGLGSLRYRGPSAAADHVLRRRPEAITAPGRVQAWLLGSGWGDDSAAEEVVDEALESGLPIVLDAGALTLVDRARGPVVATPHSRELARLLGVEHERVQSDRESAAREAAQRWGIVVLAKGFETLVIDGTAGADITQSLRCASAPTWLATAGAGDALAGVLGALVATHAEQPSLEPGWLARLAAAAAVIHGLAAQRASAGGPLVVLEVAEQVSPTIAALLAEHR